MKLFALPSLAGLSLIALAGCADDSNLPPMFCPQVAVLQQAGTLTAFVPGKTDVASQITTAQITGVAGACVLQSKKHLLNVNFQAGFSATNGPANNGKPLTLPYFVALTRGDHIISKTDYTITLTFDGNASTAQATTKPVKIEVSNDHASAHVEVLVGFELTPEQISYAAAHAAH